MSRVLVTGASGFIGRHCLPLLVRAGHDVHAVSLASSLKVSNVAFHRVDLLDPSAVQEICGDLRPELLLHLAWYAIPGKFWSAPENLDWVSATLHLVRSFARHGGKRIVGAGSCAEYDWGYGVCEEATTPVVPASLYGISKWAVSTILSKFASMSGMSQAWGRIFFLYGPHESPTRLIASLISSLQLGRPALCTHGHQRRDFLHVEDVASAFIAILESSVEGAVNICSGESIAVRDIANSIGAKMNAMELLRFNALTPSDEVPLLVGNNQRLRNLGWRQKFSLDSGLDDAIHWWKTYSAMNTD